LLYGFGFLDDDVLSRDVLVHSAAAGGHTIVVTDCYRTSVDAPKTETAGGLTTYSFAPCRDAQVVIRGDQLVVNGQSYGRIGPTDSVLVDHGVVSTHAESAK